MQAKRFLLNFSLFLLILILFTWVGREVVVKNRGTRTDFYAIWYGSNSVLEQISPYSWEVTKNIHDHLSGRILAPGVYVHSFAYPAYLAIVLLPFAILPYPIAFLVWTGIQLPMLFAALYLLVNFLEIELKKISLIFLFLAGSIGFLYPLVSYALGQTSIFLLFLVAITLFLAKRMKLTGAGIFLACIAIRPDIFIITGFATLIIVWESMQAIKGLVLSTVISFVTMNVLSVFLLGFWYADWINMLREYSINNPKTHWPLELLPSTTFSTVIVLILLAYTLWQFLRFIKTPTKDKKVFFISTLFLIHSIIFKVTGSYQMTMLLIPALFLLYFYTQRMQQWIIWFMLITPWLFFGIIGKTDSIYNILLLPSSFLLLQVFLLSPAEKQLSDTGNV